MKETGMSIKDIKKYTELRQLEDPPVEELMQLLLLHRKKIQEQLNIYQKNLAMLDKKISIYRQEVKTTRGKDLYDYFVTYYDDFLD